MKTAGEKEAIDCMHVWARSQIMLLKSQKLSLSLSAAQSNGTVMRTTDSSLIATITRPSCRWDDIAGVHNVKPTMLTAGGSAWALNHQLSHSRVSWSDLHTSGEEPARTKWSCNWFSYFPMSLPRCTTTPNCRCVCVCITLLHMSNSTCAWVSAWSNELQTCMITAQ